MSASWRGWLEDLWMLRYFIGFWMLLGALMAALAVLVWR